MKNNLLIMLLLTVNATAFAAENKVQDITVDSILKDKTVELIVKSSYPSDIMITGISQFTNNEDACAISNSQYVIKPNVAQPIFPFSSKDQSICFSRVHLFERYNNGAYPTVLGFLDPDNPTKIAKIGDYLSDWGSFIVNPVVFKITYSYQNTYNQKGVVKYFVYKINE